jgi:type II secretory pathway pseudopilin PulG
MVRINEVADDTGVNYPSPISRRRRPQAVVSVDSGFVLILVLPVAMLLLMTTLSLIWRSNSAAITSARDSRAQAARMAAEFGLNQLMAQINTEDSDKLSELTNDPTPIEGEDGNFATSYTIDPPIPDFSTVTTTCTNSDDDNKPIEVTVSGTLTDGAVTYQQNVRRTIWVCVIEPNKEPKQLRVRAVR